MTREQQRELIGVFIAKLEWDYSICDSESVPSQSSPGRADWVHIDISDDQREKLITDVLDCDEVRTQRDDATE